VGWIGIAVLVASKRNVRNCATRNRREPGSCLLAPPADDQRSRSAANERIALLSNPRMPWLSRQTRICLTNPRIHSQPQALPPRRPARLAPPAPRQRCGQQRTLRSRPVVPRLPDRPPAVYIGSGNHTPPKLAITAAAGTGCILLRRRKKSSQPVVAEVMLCLGICGIRGPPTRRSARWMLSRDSVGQLYRRR